MNNAHLFPPAIKFFLLGVLAWFLVSAFGAVALAQDVDPSIANISFLGGQTFKTNCSNCHGVEGKGDGHLAPYLDDEPADLTRLSQNNGGVFPAERIYKFIDGRQIRQGKRHEMPIWGDAFQTIREEERHRYPVGEDRVREKIYQLVVFLDTIQQ